MIESSKILNNDVLKSSIEVVLPTDGTAQIFKNIFDKSLSDTLTSKGVSDCECACECFCHCDCDCDCF